MIRPLLAITNFIYWLLQRYAPSNIVLRWIRSRGGLKWGMPAMLLAVPYLGFAFWYTSVAAGGGPGWLRLVVLLCLWNALKFIAFGPISLIILCRVRVKELDGRRDGEKVSELALT